MAQETIVDFSVIKQKIIKTDEILRMYQETTNKLKKVQQAYKELKSNYDQTIFNLNRLQLENERCTFNLENLKSHQDGREKENKELREQIALLEDKYNHQAIQSQLEIKKLEDEIKVSHDVKVSNIKLKKKMSNRTEQESDKKVKSLEGTIKELKDIQTKYKKEIEELNKKNEKMTTTLFASNQQYAETIKRLENENKCLLEKIDNPNNRVEKDKEINELKKKICCLTLDKSRDKSKLKTVEEENEKLKQQLMDQEMTLFNASQEKSDVWTQTDMFPKNQKSTNYGQIMDSIETHKLEESPYIDTEAQHKEIVKLKKVISSLIVDKNELRNIKDRNEKLNWLLIKQENSIFDVKEKKVIADFCMQTDISPKNKRTIHVQTLDSMKGYKSQETLHIENQTLNQSVLDYKTEIMNLRAKLKISEKQYNTKAMQTEQPDSDVKFLEDILEEMRFPIPKMLSPMSPQSHENLKVDRAPTPISDAASVIPDVIVTPPTPTIEAILDFQNDQTSTVLPKEEDISLQNNIGSTNNDVRNSRKSDGKIPYFKKIPKRRKYRSPFISNDFVRLRKDYFSRPYYILNKHMFRREMSRKVRKLKNQDCILTALQTLKRSKINFTISNESTLPNCWSNNSWLNDYQLASSNMNPSQANPNKSTGLTPKFKNTKYLTEKLNCTFQSCNKVNCYMLLNKQNDATELLGFFSVKDEIITPSYSRMDNVLGNKPSDYIRSVNPTLSDTIKLTSGGLLETLADLVSKKLKQRENSKRERSTISENNFDSFNSETETELETLFEKPAYILKRNKILFKKAKQNKRCESLSASSFEEHESQRREVEDTCNTSTESVPSPYETEETLNNNRNTAPEHNILQNINENVSVSKDFGGETEESCDSLKFSTCPDLISPLSTISRGFRTPPSKLRTVWPVKSSKEHNVYINENPVISPNKETEKRDGNDLYQTEDNLENERIPMESNLIEQSSGDFSSNSCSYITRLNSTENGICLNDSSTSSTINTYLCDEKELSKDINSLLINFEEEKYLIEDNRKIEEGQIRDNKSDSVLHLRSLLNADGSPVRLNPLGEKIATSDHAGTDLLQNDKLKTNVSSELDSSPLELENKLQIQNIKSTGKEKSKAVKNLVFPSMNVFKEQALNYSIAENEKSLAESSKESSPKKSSIIFLNITAEENISSSVFNEDHFIMAKDNKEMCSLQKHEVKNISSCPESPVHEGLGDLVNPIIIPLEKLNGKDVSDDFCTGNISSEISNSPKSLDYEDMKIRSTNKDQKDDVLPQLINSSNNIEYNTTMLSTIETNFMNTLNEDRLHLTNTEKVYHHFEKAKNVVGRVYHGDFINSGSGYICLSSSKDEFAKQEEPVSIRGQNASRKISSVPKINENLVTDNVTDKLVRKEMDLDNVDPNYMDKKHKISKSTNPSSFDAKIVDPSLSYIDTTTDQSTEDKMRDKNIPSCPQSPINDYRDKVDFTVPKIIPLDKMECQEGTSTLSFYFDPQKSNLTEYSLTPCTTQHDINEEKSTSINSSDIGKILPVDMTSRGNEKTNDNKSIKDITRDILNALPNEEAENRCIPSCPQSPINDYNDKVDFTDPKIIPLENMKSEDASNASDSFCNSSVDEESIESENDLLKVNKCDNHNNNQTSTLLRKRKYSTSPLELRRSKRTLKRNNKYSNSEEYVSTPKPEDTDPSIVKNKRLKITEAQTSSLRLKNLKTEPQTLNISEIVVPVKRKRGRPRKQPVKSIELSQFDDMKCTENISDLIYNQKDEVANQNSSLDSSQQSTLEEKNIESFTEQSLKTVHEIPLEGNLEINTTLIQVDNHTNEADPTGLNENNAMADLLITKSNDNDLEGTVGQNNSLSTLTKKNLDELGNKNKNKETVCRNRVVKRRPITKLKSNILKQFKEKRKMFQTNFEIGNFAKNLSACDTKSNLSESNVDIKETNMCVDNKNKINVTSLDVECTSNISESKEKCNRKKIHVVQNILIPPNSNYSVDLLERKEYASNCDIRLDDPRNSSQNSINIDNFAFQKSNNSINTNDNIPIKTKRRIKKKQELKKPNVNQGNDILSQIIEEMDKDKKTKILPNEENKISKPKENISADISDGQWRKSILDIAECTHNISTSETDGIIMAGKGGLCKNPRDPPSKKVKILMSRLVQLSSDEKIADEIILEFKRHAMDTIADIILQKVSRDIVDKADNKYYPAPLMTTTQRILLNLMVRLESENVENLMETFLTKAEHYLFRIGCGIRTMVPVTRLYMAVCRLRANVNRMRAFCLNAFLSMNDLAVPLLFIVLTSWTEILPMESSLKYYPLTKVFVQVVHLKNCNRSGYNLLPLRQLLNQFYGYPKDRWNCDEVFEELFQQYLRNPVPSISIGIRVLCKNKDTKWAYKKVNEFLKPLIYKIPAENVNFKATAIILIGNICKQFKPDKELDETYLNDVRRWLIGLTEGDEVADIVERSVDISLLMLPKKRLKAKNCKKKRRVVNVIINNKNKKRVKRLKRK